jgi:hypothetical protein
LIVSPMLFWMGHVRRLYYPIGIRIRQWGALPDPRGPSVLITNHQHVDEGEIVYTRTCLLHPHIRVTTVNSRRTFETGFIAARLPWTAAFTRRWDLTWLWHGLGILPIENHLHSRALISLVEEIRNAHGDLTLETILSEDVLAPLGLSGLRLGDLWTARHFTRAQTPVKLARLHQPYRREALENFRTTVARDVAAVVDRVREGATLYVTPEGDFTHDGRLRPMRNGITDAVLPIAEPWLCAIAYDPFRGRRLSMLYRILRPADRDDLGTSLAAARPVTTSALLATFLCATDGPFGAAGAQRAVRVQLDALPRNLFVDPELRRAPDAVVSEALAVLSRRGTLARDGPLYRLTSERGDRRFPHVADMLTYQRNMLEETLEAAARLRGDG